MKLHSGIRLQRCACGVARRECVWRCPLVIYRQRRILCGVVSPRCGPRALKLTDGRRLGVAGERRSSLLVGCALGDNGEERIGRKGGNGGENSEGGGKNGLLAMKATILSAWATLKLVFEEKVRMVLSMWRDKMFEWQRQAIIRFLACIGSILFVHVWVNVALLPKINKKLPTVSRSVSKLLKREVEIDRVKWLAPTGILGFHPIARVGTLALGPGEVEKSHVCLQTVDVKFDPLRSILRGRLLLALQSHGGSFHLKQAYNYSWFGFPDDTVPSSRFVPPPENGGKRSGKQRTRARTNRTFHRRSHEQASSMEICRNIPILQCDGNNMMHHLRDWHVMKTSLLERSLTGVTGTRNNLFLCSASPNQRRQDTIMASMIGNTNTTYQDQKGTVTEMGGHVCPQNSDLERGKKLNDQLVSFVLDLEHLYHIEDPQKESKGSVEMGDEQEQNTHAPCTKQISDINQLPVCGTNRLEDQVACITKSSESYKYYCSHVEDPGTAKKKMLGSKALQKARNWKPAKTISREFSPQTSPKISIPKASIHEKELKSRETIKNMKAEVKSMQSLQEKGKHMLQSVREKPAYTPAPVDLSIEQKRYKRARSWLKAILTSTAEKIAKGTALESLDCYSGTLYAYIYDESMPRIFKNVELRSHFGKNYDSLKIDIMAEPEKRNPETYQCTMKSEITPRHLRGYIGSPEYADMGSTATLKDEDTSGGKVAVHIEAENVVHNDMAKGGPKFPSMQIIIKGTNLHAPLIERIVELPIDIEQGRLDGQLIISSEDAASWDFPRFSGRVGVRNAKFHFWDATDDIMDAKMDLIFEGDRVYLHKAQGYFGAVPMKVTGDLDLNPLSGEYRISASVPGVEVNALRATLGVRPTPFSVAGAVEGTMHVTGPLEKPIFSGHAHVIRPSEKMIRVAENSPALFALKSTAESVGAYDRIPFHEAGLVFSLNTANNTMTLHAIHGHLVDGGQMHGAGVMNISPTAEMDPNALDIIVRGSDIQQEALVKRLIPEATLPEELSGGLSSATVVMKGGHLAPVIDVNFTATSGASGSSKFQRHSTAVSLSSAHFDASGTIYLDPPSFTSMKQAKTQEQASKLAKPKIKGCSMDVSMKGFDVLPFLSDDNSLRSISKSSGEPVKLRVNGRVKVEGDVEHSEFASRNEPWIFKGLLNLENLRLNQMKLYRDLKGTLDLSQSRLSAHAKGMRPEELLDVELDVPLMTKESHIDKNDKREIGDSYVDLRCGRLHASGSVMEHGTEMDFRIANLKLDELEVASLRGDLQEASCSLNFQSKTGRGRASILAPKYSGMLGESLSGGFRWEKDVFRLEKLVLQQKQSRYEVQGEYVLPPTFVLPNSAVDILSRSHLENSLTTSASGRWRLRVDAPYAEIQEVTPAGRLLQTVNDQFPIDYEQAKSAFIKGLASVQMRLEDLNDATHVLLEKINAIPQISSLKGSSDGPMTKNSEPLHLPALQTCQGSWNGSVQAFGGGGGATSCDFDIRGQNWKWGDAILESLVAKGSGHSEEGIQLQEFVLKSGDAKLLIRGNLLNENQDATMLLTDFPVASLQPLFQAIPALKHAAPAVPARNPDPIASPLPLGIIASTINKLSAESRENNPLSQTSPINGQLFMSGTLNGSKDAPSGEINLRIYDGAIGSTRLSRAQASATLMDGENLSFELDLVPADGQRSSGHISASGNIPAVSVSDHNASLNGGKEMDIRVSVKDGGMAVLTAVTPNLKWRQGNAELSANITGSLKQPNIQGGFMVSKAFLDCPVLKYPLNIATADVRCADDIIVVKGVDARVGRKGRIRVRGSLPLYHEMIKEFQNKARITLDLQGLEVKARNMYTGQLDALLTARDSLERPVVGGSMRFSKGSIYLNPQGQETGLSSQNMDESMKVSGSNSTPLAPSVSKVFTLLTRGDTGLAAQLEDAVRQEVEAVESIVEDSAGSNAVLDGLAVQFGPDLRAVYPLVMNFGISGELVASGPAHPETVLITGSLNLPSGEVNLLAAQFELDREHENMVVFGANSGSKAESSKNVPAGIDPLVDIVLNSGDLKVSVSGRASEWSEHLVMQTVGQGRTMEASELDALEAAKVLEAKLKAALLADNGQIALSKLAGSTMATFMPRIETQGSVGETKWRLVSAPSVPGLLDPREASTSNVLDFLTLGAEVEVAFGKRLQAAMVRKLRESDVVTKWTLNYNLSSKLRMQFNISSMPPYPKTLTFQYSSEGGE